MTPDVSSMALAVEVGRELDRHDSRDGLLAAVSRAAAERVPGTRWASVTELHSGRFTTVAASDGVARTVDGIQYELGTGPCLDAITTGAVVRTENLADDDRWAAFARRATTDHGVASMLSLPLHADQQSDRGTGLNLYATAPDAFSTTAETAATLLTMHGSLAIEAAAAREEVANLRRALVNSRLIGTALGVLMSSRLLTADQAFEQLRIASQNGNRKLVDVAAEVAETGTLGRR